MSDPIMPTCAVCGGPVDRLTRIPDPINGDAVFDAYCHGRVDRTVIDRRDLEEGPLELFGGIAFWQEKDRLLAGLAG